MGTSIDVLESRLLFNLKLNVAYDRIQNIGQLPQGARIVAPIDGGEFEGPLLRGAVLPGGADWVVFRGDGAMLIDVRVTLQTDDDARIYMQYRGIAHAAPEIMTRFNRREVLPYPSFYARTVPSFETGAARYAWLNKIIAVANGARTADGPEYRVFEIL